MPLRRSRGDSVTVEVGETTLEFRAGRGAPFYHFALLVPGDRFDAARRWAAERVALLPADGTDDTVFDFEHWDARAVYFHDPGGSIGELIAHRGVGESGETGPFDASELLGFSEVGIVGDPPSLAAALSGALALEVWSGTVSGEGQLAFVGEKARTLDPRACRTSVAADRAARGSASGRARHRGSRRGRSEPRSGRSRAGQRAAARLTRSARDGTDRTRRLRGAQDATRNDAYGGTDGRS